MPPEINMNPQQEVLKKVVPSYMLRVPLDLLEPIAISTDPTSTIVEADRTVLSHVEKASCSLP